MSETGTTTINDLNDSHMKSVIYFFIASMLLLAAKPSQAFRISKTKVEMLLPKDSITVRYGKPFSYTINITNTGKDSMYETDTIYYNVGHDWRRNEPIVYYKKAIGVNIGPGESFTFSDTASIRVSDDKRDVEYLSFRVTALFFGPRINSSGHLHIETWEERDDNDAKVTLRYDGFLSNKIEDLKQSNIKVYPNPSKGVIYVEGEINKEYSIEVCNLRGEAVYVTQWKSGESLDINHLARGIYILCIRSNSEKINRKITLH
jgi:hypothetical protein